MERLNEILNKYVAQGDDTKNKVLGAALVVVNKDGPIYKGTAGRLGFPTDSPKFGTDSLFWAASMTKLVASGFVMEAVEKGLLGIDDDMRPLVPELDRMQILKGFSDDDKPIYEDNVTPITLRTLLTHTAGLAYDTVTPDLIKWSAAIGRTVTNLSCTYPGWDTPLLSVPGESWVYGSAIDWACLAAEKVSGTTFGQWVTEKVLRPLDLRDTTFHPRDLADRVAGRTVVLGMRRGETLSPDVPDFLTQDPPVESGGGGLYTTADEYAKILQSILATTTSTVKSGSEPAAKTGDVFSKRVADDMFQPQLSKPSPKVVEAMRAGVKALCPVLIPEGVGIDHGLGGVVNTDDIPGRRKKGSLAWLGAGNTHWWIDPESGIAAVLSGGVVPLCDAPSNKLYVELETAIYEDLLPSIKAM